MVTSWRWVPSIRLVRLVAERQENLAGLIFRLAERRLATDAVGGETAHATLNETRPHASVDPARIRALDDERPERASGRRQFRPVTFDRDHAGLKAKRSERVTYPLQSGSKVSRRLQFGCGGELAAEVLAGFAQGLRPATGGNLPYQEADQLCQAPVRELDTFEFRCDAVDLGRPAGSGSAPAAASLARDREESCLNEPVETTAGDVEVHAEFDRRLGGGKRIAPAARVQEDPPKLRIAGRCKPIERHRGKPTRLFDVGSLMS
jgi:hypothetical protein